MKKIKIISLISIIYLVFVGCEQNSTYDGSTGNIYSIKVDENFNLNNLSYGWYILKSPKESELVSKNLLIKNSGKEMSFKPDMPGDYIFQLIVYNNNGKSIKENTYEFNINLSSNITINVDSTSVKNLNKNDNQENKVNKNKKISEKKSKNNKSIKKLNNKKLELIKKKLFSANEIESLNGNYTIQIFSEKTQKDAEEKMLELKNKGLDSYIQKAYFEKTDQLWYRVRVGNFTSENEAKIAALEISGFTNFKTWVDKVRVE